MKQRFVLMKYYSLSFLLDFFVFFYFLHEWKIILVNLRRSFFYLYFRHLVYVLTLSFIRLFLCERFVTYNTSFWSRRDKRSIRVYFLLYLYFLDNYFLLYYWFFWDKIFVCMFILNWQYFCSNKRISKLFFSFSINSYL